MEPATLPSLVATEAEREEQIEEVEKNEAQADDVVLKEARDISTGTPSSDGRGEVSRGEEEARDGGGSGSGSVMDQPRTGKAKVADDLEIHYELYGSGSSKLFFIMGLATSGRAWKATVRYVVEKYSDEYEVCIFDNRGCGHSSCPRSTFSTKAMAQDAHGLLEHLGWQAVHVVGISMGGMIAQELALMLGKDRLLSLSLAVTHAGGVYAIAPLTGVWGMAKGIFMKPEDKVVPLMKILHSEKWLSSKSATDPTKTNLDVVCAAYLDRVSNEPLMSIPGLRGHLRAVSTHYVSKHRLKQIKSFGAPILVVTGTHDHLVRAKNSYKLSEVLEPDEFLVFEGAGHAVNMECLEDFCEAVVRNVKRAEDKGNSTEESGDSPLDDEDKEETTPVTASADAEKGKHKAEE